MTDVIPMEGDHPVLEDFDGVDDFLIPESVRMFGRTLSEHEKRVVEFDLALKWNVILWRYTHRFARDYLLYSVEERKRLSREAELV